MKIPKNTAPGFVFKDKNGFTEFAGLRSNDTFLYYSLDDKRKRMYSGVVGSCKVEGDMIDLGPDAFPAD